MGMPSQDTAELLFEDCRIPADNLLGQEGRGFMMLMEKLQQERLVVAIGAQAGAEDVLDDTIEYTQERQAFGKPIAKFQNTQFKLAECATEGRGRPRLRRPSVERARRGQAPRQGVLDGEVLADRDVQARRSTPCLQFFGGYGYMLEYPISRAYMDARVQTIFAGTNEIMKIIIAKSMGL